MLTLNDGRKDLYQWDIGRIATVDISCQEVHFANTKHGVSLAAIVRSKMVEIPNQLLTTGAPIYFWAFVEDSDGRYTKKEGFFDVKKRPKPSDYVYTQTEVRTIEAVVDDAIEKAVQSGDFNGPQGPKGEKGDKGDRGEKGEQGIQGEKGDEYILTSADKNEIADIVVDILPKWNGGEY